MVEEASSGTLLLAADADADAGGGVVERGDSAGGCGVSASGLFGSGAFLVLFPVLMALSTFSSKSDEVVVPETDESSKVLNSALGPGILSDDLFLRFVTPSSDDHLDEWRPLRANLPEDEHFVRLRVRPRAGIDAEPFIGEEAEERRLWSSLLHLCVRVGELYFILARRSRAPIGVGLFISWHELWHLAGRAGNALEFLFRELQAKVQVNTKKELSNTRVT